MARAPDGSHDPKVVQLLEVFSQVSTPHLTDFMAKVKQFILKNSSVIYHSNECLFCSRLEGFLVEYNLQQREMYDF